MLLRHTATLLLAALLPITALAADPAPTVARWKDDRTAAFLLMFDDSWPSHFQVAGPELEKRGLIATFYICPGKGEYQKFAAEWETKLWKSGQVYGDHTMTHKGVKDLANADWEIGEAARLIRKIPAGPEDRLVSYAQPGVGEHDWNITESQLAELLQKHHLISRPPFNGHGAVYHLQTTAQMLALADKAIASQGMEYLVIHGVERLQPDWGYQDFWPLKQDVFFPLLDGLKERRDAGKLWVTDHISEHQYETERSTAQLTVLNADAKKIRLKLTCAADPKSYTLPLTVILPNAHGWKKITVTQGTQTTTPTPAANARFLFDALPDGTPIEIASVE